VIKQLEFLCAYLSLTSLTVAGACNSSFSIIWLVFSDCYSDSITIFNLELVFYQLN
jgi:hypothetical protein